MKTPPSAGNTEPEQSFQPAEEKLPLLKLLFSGGLREDQRSLADAPLAIGREVDPDDGLELPDDKQVSAMHATVHARPEGYIITDQGSLNHTFVNGEQITEHLLVAGDIIRIGNSVLLFCNSQSNILDAPVGCPAAYEILRGTSAAIGRLRHSLSRAAGSQAPVLLQGATGAGKELSVQVLHELSGPPGRPLIRINCAQLTASLAESQLFGHADNAFSGARAHKGILREADGGTLFLDEIADLAPELQPMLLRVLEDCIVRPIGARRAEETKVKVRFVAATNRDLDHLIHAERFRDELLARLSILPIELPLLRDRQEDILPLFMYFLRQPERLLSGRLCEKLLCYPWPKNVRELRGVAEFARTMSPGDKMLDTPDVEQKLYQPRTAPVGLAAAPVSAGKPTTRKSLVKHYTLQQMKNLLARHNGVKAFAAKEVGISPRQLTRYLKKFGLESSALRADGHGEAIKH